MDRIAFKKLTDSMDNDPEVWKFGSHEIQNVENGISIWIANTFLDVEITSPIKNTLSFFQKIEFQYHLGKLQDAKLITLLDTKETKKNE